MFSNSSSFFGTSSVLKEQAALRDIERHRAKRSSVRRESLAVGANINVLTHQYTADPTLAWEMLKEKRPVKPVRQMKLDTPVRPDHVRFVCIGCTHGVQIDPANLPPGDVLLVAGDFTSCGLPNEVHSFNKKLGHLKHAYKVVIAGNHECTFDDSFLRASNRELQAKEMALKQALQASLASTKTANSKNLLTNCIYLEDSVIELFGITIYGTPWQPRVDNWAFNLTRGQPLLDKWNNIPAGVDVLLTHTPPLGHGDMMTDGQRMGCVELLNSVSKRIKPKYHVFSHIHEGYGCTSDGYTKFINCCICDENLQATNNPIIFDIPVHPHTKQFYLQNVKKIMKRYRRSEKK
ncbi:Metallophosphoesterase domain-containing protein 1 [Trichostrongylus colubriformis]|uniref:Metallophosphoesterase domain-containing protein 1 n=1 Tax=Trichostrongylus colubriformis TaxID=6319 RepID=A0AAN8EXW7_TRICO